jgi:uncharacterized protein YjbJ (UPF0337 family)
MNRDQFEGNWHILKGKIKEKWGKLTDDDITKINGKYEQFIGKLQKKYGYTREQAERESNSWKYEDRFENRSEFQDKDSWGERNDRKNEDFDESNRNSMGRNEREGQQENKYGKGEKKHPSNCGCGSCKNKRNEKDKYDENDFRDKKRKVG